MDLHELQIIRPELRYQGAFLRFLEAFEAAGETSNHKTAEIARGDFQGYLDILAQQARGIDNENGFNREQVYWLLLTDGQIIADARLRYPITESVEKTQGHVGMSVHPSFRRQGCASFIAEFIRSEATGMGMDHLTVQAAESNLASRRLITKFGGVLIDEYDDDDTGEMSCLYRIEFI